MSGKTKKLTTIAMLCAIAYVVMYLSKLIPFTFVLPFLHFDFKDVVIVIGGFIYGPLAALVISVVVSLIEMLTLSDSGIIGCLMNVLASAAFACTASSIYKKRRDLKGAVLGLVFGCVMMTVVMVLWNYIVTPFYMTVGGNKVQRSDIAALIVPVFLPFNLLKSVLNAAATMLLYKPIVGGLRRAKLVPSGPMLSVGAAAAKHRLNPIVYIAAAVALATAVLLALIFTGII